MMQTFSTRNEWLSARTSYLGASEIGAILNCGHPMTPFKLSAKKLGIAPDEEETKEMRRGRLLEDDAITCVQEDNPTWDVRPNVLPHLRYFTNKENLIAATPDAFITLPDREGDGILQIKTVGSWAWKKSWVEDGEVACPTWVAVQATIEAALTGSKFAFVAALRTDPGLVVDTIEIPLIDGLYESACGASRAFWDKVVKGEMYEPDFSRDAKFITALYGSSLGKPEYYKVDLSEDNEVHDLADEYRRHGAALQKARDGRDKIKAQMLFKMNGAGVAVVNGDEFATVKIVNKKAHMVKASSYPLLTFEEPNGHE